MFLSPDSIKISLDKLFAKADHMIKIWFTLKQMGLTDNQSVDVTTSNSDEALKRLFSFGHPQEKLFVPFAHTTRFMEMQGDASRSIIQTNIKRWSEKTVVDTDPTSYLDISDAGQNGITVRTGRHYPKGLGYGKNGFALEDGAIVMIPDLAFAVWYYRQSDLSQNTTVQSLIESLQHDLHLSSGEMGVLFTADRNWQPTFQATAIPDKDLYQIVSGWMNGRPKAEEIIKESPEKYNLRIRSNMTISEGPKWLRSQPKTILEKLLSEGSKAIILLGAPRTGKTRAIKEVIAGELANSYTIQIHDGWGYDELMISFRPDENGNWDWVKGKLLDAIESGKKFIVLEEINRTRASQALGEVFSLLEEGYRGQGNAIKLRNGQDFFIPEEVVIFATMNTIDKSTEDLDDALLGRFAAVEYPPRVEDLISMLEANGIQPATKDKLAELFTYIQPFYPLGHGYFAGVKVTTDVIDYYQTRIRAVLKLHLQSYRDEDLAKIDEKVDELFGT